VSFSGLLNDESFADSNCCCNCCFCCCSCCCCCCCLPNPLPHRSVQLLLRFHTLSRSMENSLFFVESSTEHELKSRWSSSSRRLLLFIRLSLFLSPSLTPLIVISVCPSLSFFLPLSRSVSLPGWESLFMRMVITGVRRCSPSPSPKDLQSKLLTQRAAVHQHYEITHVFGNLRRSKAIWQLSKLIRFFFCSVYYYAPWRIGDWPEDTSPYEDWPMTYSKSIRRSDTKSS